MISSTPIFAALDILATLTYYKDVLGFESSWTWGDPPSFGAASIGGVTLMFNLLPELAKKVAGHENWIRVDDADTLYAMHQARGAKIVAEIEDKPWGAREYVVEDINGYHLRFAGPPQGDVANSVSFPAEVTIEPRKPTPEEFARVAGAAFEYKAPEPGLIEQTWNGVVAKSPSGEVIGVLRIMWDAPGWYSIWDVAVLPEWQAQRIGSALMKEALDTIKAVCPSAIVYLFTYKHGFYERLGFGKDTVTMRRL